MSLAVVRTGNVALDRFLDDVRRKIDSLESTTRFIRVSGGGGGGSSPGALTVTAADLAHIEKLARGITNSRLAQDLRTPIDPKRIQAAVDALRAEVRARIEAVKSDLLGNFQVGIDASLIKEIEDRSAAVEAEAIERADSIYIEAHTRLLQVQETAEAALRALTAVHQETTSRQVAVALARSDLTTYVDEGVSAEAAQRTILAAKILGSDGTGANTGLIYDERVARVTGDQALASQITLLSAGAGEQFDWKKIWYFDSGVESWTGATAPTTVSGWLRPANGSPAVTSPTGLSIDAAHYGQVRFRVRKFGTLTWSGLITWNGGSIVADEPTYDANDIGLVTISPGWTGTVDYVSVQAYTTQDSTNRFEIDWFAVGRPSPGASAAQLLEEQTARANAISAEATSRQTLSAKMTGLADPSSVTLATLTSGLLYDERTARVTANDARVTDINSIQARVTTLDDPVNGTVKQLTSSVDEINEVIADLGTTSASAATEVISLGRNFERSSGQTAEALLRDIIATDKERKSRIYEVAIARNELTTKIVDGLSAEAASRSTLASRVGATETLISVEQTARATADTALSESITLLNADIGTTNAAVLAETTARATSDTALASDITTLEATVVSNNTTVNAAISTEQSARASADTAIASNVTALATRVGVAEAGILSEQTARSTADSALASDITTLTATVGTNNTAVLAAVASESTARAAADTAIASDLTLLTTRVGTAEADIINEQTARSTADTALASSITALTSSVGANASAIVTEANTRASGDSANAALITTLTSRVDGAESDIAAVETSASTSASKITGLEAKYTVKVTAGGKVAGFGLASSSNTADGSTTSFIVQADKFGIVSSDGTTSKVPFGVDTVNGKIVMQADVSISGDLVVTGSIKNDALANATIEGPKIKGGTITPDKIDTRGLTIKDANGNVVFSAGAGLSSTLVSGLGSLATKNSVSATSDVTGLGALATKSTVSATSDVTGLGSLATKNSAAWGVDVSGMPANVSALTGAEQIKNSLISISETAGTITLSGGATGTIANVVTGNNKITSGNVSTYIADAAIGNAYIGNLAASKITTGTLSAERIGVGSITSDKIGTNDLSAVNINTTGRIRSTGSYTTSYAGGMKGSVVGENSAADIAAAGVFGYGYYGIVGLSGQTGANGASVRAINVGAAGTALWMTGYLKWDNDAGTALRWASPPAIDATTKFMRADGMWAAPPTVSSIAWANVTGKPTEFAPSTHTHDYAATIHAHAYSTASDVAAAISANNSAYVSPNFAVIGHNHSGEYTTSADVTSAINANNVGLNTYFSSGRTIHIPGVGTFTNCSIT